MDKNSAARSGFIVLYFGNGAYNRFVYTRLRAKYASIIDCSLTCSIPQPTFHHESSPHGDKHTSRSDLEDQIFKIKKNVTFLNGSRCKGEKIIFLNFQKSSDLERLVHRSAEPKTKKSGTNLKKKMNNPYRNLS